MESTTPQSDSMTLLTAVLGRFSVLADVAAALGIQDPASQPDEFWTEQRRAARQRTFMFAQQRRGDDIIRERKTLNANEAQAVVEEVERMQAEGLTYAEVRQWFIHRGQFEQNKAVALRREANAVAERGLRVLLLLEEGGARYLAYDKSGTVKLVTQLAEAHVFPVQSVSELEPAYLQNMASNFEAARHQFKAKQVKILAGPRS